MTTPSPTANHSPPPTANRNGELAINEIPSPRLRQMRPGSAADRIRSFRWSEDPLPAIDRSPPNNHDNSFCSNGPEAISLAGLNSKQRRQLGRSGTTAQPRKRSNAKQKKKLAALQAKFKNMNLGTEVEVPSETPSGRKATISGAGPLTVLVVQNADGDVVGCIRQLLEERFPDAAVSIFTQTG